LLSDLALKRYFTITYSIKICIVLARINDDPCQNNTSKNGNKKELNKLLSTLNNTTETRHNTTPLDYWEVKINKKQKWKEV
jgi:hypothetical protein